jgi:hypothetical protein
MSQTDGWDQSQFDGVMDRYFARLNQDKLPRAINKKMFFIALRALAATPKKDPFAISTDLSRQVMAVRKDGRTGILPIGWIIAAKRLGKTWQERKMRLGENLRAARRVNVARAYLSALAKLFDKMLAARKRSGRFMSVGWLSVVKELGSHVQNKSGAPSGDSDVKLRGSLKGNARPATAGRLLCTIENTASAKSDKRFGIIRFGQPALDDAFRDETANTAKFLEDEALKEETERANRELK